MAYIQPNKLLPPTARVIRPYQCSFIAVEGPNIIGKLNMSGVEIPYDSQFSTRMTLNPGATSQPLLYGFLGSNVTFVLLKFTYDETDPICNIEEEQFVTYYFEDQPSIKRYANKLLLLTGNSVHRIPQLFLDNPSEVKVIVEALVANLEQSDISVDSVRVVTIDNLYYNNILSDTIWVQSTLVSGSTQLEIIGTDGYVALYLNYLEILTIESQDSTYELIITTPSDTTIILRFLSLFEMHQARSRISWVTKVPASRYLTIDYPTVDLASPVFGINPAITPIAPNTYVIPFSGFTILPEEVLAYFVTGITDARDGVISVDSATIVIREYGYVTPLTGVTSVGVYDVIITVADIADNYTMLNYIMIADDVPPVITFKPLASGTGFTMATVDMSLPTVGITPDDIIRKSVDVVTDTVDGTIPNANIVITAYTVSGFTGFTALTDPGEYLIRYYVEDRAGNSVTYEKTITNVGNKVLVNGETYIIANYVTNADLNVVGGSGMTATIVLSGVSFVIGVLSGATSGTTDDELVWDLGGLGEYNFGSGGSGTINVTVLGTLFTLTFTRGSLLLNIAIT